MKFACRDIRYITDPLTRHEKTFLKSFLSGVYAGVIFLAKTMGSQLVDDFKYWCIIDDVLSFPSKA